MTSYSEVPIVIVKPGKMLGGWSQSARLFALLVATMFFMYILLLLRTMYLKDERLDQIAIAAVNAEKMIQELKNLDQQLAAEIEEIETIHAKLERYYNI